MERIPAEYERLGINPRANKALKTGIHKVIYLGATKHEYKSPEVTQDTIEEAVTWLGERSVITDEELAFALLVARYILEAGYSYQLGLKLHKIIIQGSKEGSYDYPAYLLLSLIVKEILPEEIKDFFITTLYLSAFPEHYLANSQRQYSGAYKEEEELPPPPKLKRQKADNT